MKKPPSYHANVAYLERENLWYHRDMIYLYKKWASITPLPDNKAGYTAQDAPSMRTFHLKK